MLVLALTGCLPEVLTANGELLVVAPDLKVIGSYDVTAPLLAGTVTCPEIRCNGFDCPSDAEALACYHQGVGGNATLEGGCFTVGQTGLAEWYFEVQECEATQQGYSPGNDQLTFLVLGSDLVHAVAGDVETSVELFLEPGPEGWPPDWHAVPGQRQQILAGAPFRFFPVLVDDFELVEVGWTLSQGDPSTTGGITASWSPSTAAIEVLLDEDQAGEVLFQIGDSPAWPIRDLKAAAPDAPDELEVVVAYYRDLFTQKLTPVGARAVVRDDQGQLVWGTPVAWTLDEGHLAVGDPYLTLPGGDYVTLVDDCVPPEDNAGPHVAVLRATYGELTATAELSWTAPQGSRVDGWAPNPYCVKGNGPPPDPTDPDDPDADPGDGTETIDAEELVPTEFIAGAGGCGCAGAPATRFPAMLGLAAALAAFRRRSAR